MSGHTFKVGDRVRVVIGSTHGRTPGIIRALHNGFAWIEFDGDGEPESFLVDHLTPLPLFEPVERWMILLHDGTVAGPTFTTCPSDTLAGGARFVRALISPAEDQS